MYANLRKLVKGNQYTYVAFSSIGEPYAVAFRLKAINCTGYGYGADTFTIIGVRGVLNRTFHIHIDHRKQFIIWEGVHKADVQITKDKNYLKRALLSINVAPIVEHFIKHDNPGESHANLK